MKITKVRPICLRAETAGCVADGRSVCGARTSFLVRLETDCGLTGLGEAASFGAPLDVLKLILERQVAPLLEGQDPEREDLFERMYWALYACGRTGLVMACISAADIALWDLRGKARGQSVCRMLGGRSDRAASYASAGFYAPGKGLDSLKREMEGYLERGFRAFKMKVGRGMPAESSPRRFAGQESAMPLNFEEDLARVRTVRETVGRAPLMLDMNCTWTARTLAGNRPFLKEMDIFWLEEPVCMDDSRELQAAVQAAEGIPLAGCESAQTLPQYERLAENGVRVLQADAGWAGGLTGALRIAALARERGLQFAPHTFFGAVLNAANVHLCAALENSPFIESEENENPLRTRLLKRPLETDGAMNYLVPQAPGLGIELDPDALEAYGV